LHQVSFYLKSSKLPAISAVTPLITTFPATQSNKKSERADKIRMARPPKFSYFLTICRQEIKLVALEPHDLTNAIEVLGCVLSSVHS